MTLTLLALYAADATVKFINVAAEKAKQARRCAGSIASRVQLCLPSSCKLFLTRPECLVQSRPPTYILATSLCHGLRMQ